MERYRVQPGTNLDLSQVDPDDTSAFDGDKSDGDDRLKDLSKRLESLQERLYADGTQRLLIVLQAMDTAGKDSTIRDVFDRTNPVGVKVASFKKPTDIELAHDYLWRVHQHTPAKGDITVFNRSHYEDVLVVRVHGWVPEEQVQRRFQHIRDFERMLVEEGTTILKFFLHISADEQRDRLIARRDDPEKQWKFSKGDVAERQRWPDYMKAYQEAISATSTEAAPWYVVPSNKKWFRKVVVAQVVADALDAMDLEFPEPEDDIAGYPIP